MWDPRRGQLFIMEVKEDGGGCEMKRGRLGTDGDSVSVKKEEKVQSHNSALWKRQGKRKPAQREKGSRAGWRQGRGRLGVTWGSISISQSCHCVQQAVCSHFGRQLSLAVCLVEPALPYHPPVTLLGILFVIIQVYLCSGKSSESLNRNFLSILYILSSEECVYMTFMALFTSCIVF